MAVTSVCCEAQHLRLEEFVNHLVNRTALFLQYFRTIVDLLLDLVLVEASVIETLHAKDNGATRRHDDTPSFSLHTTPFGGYLVQ